MSNPAAVRSGRAGLVVVPSADAVRVACAERGWSQPVRARTAWKLAHALEQKPSTQLSQLLGPC